MTEPDLIDKVSTDVAWHMAFTRPLSRESVKSHLMAAACSLFLGSIALEDRPDATIEQIESASELMLADALELFGKERPLRSVLRYAAGKLKGKQ